jgi:hypothetical protein
MSWSPYGSGIDPLAVRVLAISAGSVYAGTEAHSILSRQLAGPQPTAVVSRKVHGAAGAFDINLPITGTAGVECRRGGASGDHQIVYTFPNTVTLSGATVTPAAGMFGSLNGGPNLSPDGRTVTLSLTNVSDAQTVTLTLTGVTDGSGTNDVTIQASFLTGDTNGDRVVNAGDALQTRNRAGGATDAANFRSDANTDGAVNSGDTLLVRARSGDFLP